MNDCGVCSDFKTAFSNFTKKSKINSIELGNSTWLFLHTMAAYYPKNPSELQKQKMLLFIDGLSEFYPCNICSDHLKSYMIKFPVNVETNETLSEWICKLHNNVNKENNKAIYDCSSVIEKYT